MKSKKPEPKYQALCISPNQLRKRADELDEEFSRDKQFKHNPNKKCIVGIMNNKCYYDKENKKWVFCSDTWEFGGC